MQIYKQYYKDKGMRRPGELVNPRQFIMKELPRNSMYHYLDSNKGLNIDTVLPWLASKSKKIAIEIPSELIIVKGKAKKKAVKVSLLAKKWLLKNRQFRLVKDIDTDTKDPLSISVVNYNYLDEVYKYVDLPLTRYNRWYNKYYTILDHINTIASRINKHHVIPINIPNDIPSLSILNMYKDKVNPGMLKIYHDDEMLVVLELWKWLHEDLRMDSVFNVIDAGNYSKINLLFTNSDGVSGLLNLGYLDSWLEDHENLTDYKTISQFTDKTISKFFLKMLMELQIVDSSVIDIITDDDDDKLITKLNDDKTTDELEVDDEDHDLISDVDNSIQLLDDINSRQLNQRDIKLADDAELLNIPELTEEDINNNYLKIKNPSIALNELADNAVETGLIKPAKVNAIKKGLTAFREMDDPYGSGQKLDSLMTLDDVDISLDEDTTNIAVSDLVKDKSMSKSSLASFDKTYLNKVLKRDVLACVSDIQKAGVVIKGYEIKHIESAVSNYEEHTLKLDPIDGAASTIKFRLPVVDEDGTMAINGNKLTMRKQRVDINIRKIKPAIVSLSSYYGKSFIHRSSKKANSAIAWLFKQINKEGLEEGNHIHNIAPADVYDNEFKAPYIYNALAGQYKSLKAGTITLLLDHKDRYSLGDSKIIDTLEGDKRRLIGVDTENNLVFVDYDDNFFVYKNKSFHALGDIFTLLKIDKVKAPMDITELKVFSKTIPLALVLGYYMGFKNLLKLLKVKYTTIEGTRARVEDTNYSIRFKDKAYVFDRNDKKAALILAGFNIYSKLLITVDSDELDSKDVYLDLLNSKGITTIYLRELDMLKAMFIDPITASILKSMDEPTTYIGLLLRANEMLLDYNHPDSQDTKYMRIRGYERFAGFLYSELATAVRSYKNRNVAGRSKIRLGNFDVYNSILEDNSIKIIEDINPIQNLKEREVLTYVGKGGRSSQTMNRASRAYHKHDLGIVSEATVDSTNVGVNAYLSPDANLVNVRGIVDNEKKLNPTNLGSTSMLLSPGSTHDDGKRVNFISIQNSHLVNTENYEQPYVKTGYEYVMAKRTTKEFAYAAKNNGTVTELDDKGMVVTYEDGSTEGIELGISYGKAEGSIYPLPIVANITKGKKFKKDDVLAYNSNYFERDNLDPTEVVLKTSFSVKTALYESNQTYEDSSSISSRVSDKLATTVIKDKQIVVKFEQNVIDLVSIGQDVKVNDNYLSIEDEITAVSNFSESSLDALKDLASQTPKLKYHGTISDIFVFYNGDKVDMTEGLRKIANASDRRLAAKLKSSGKTVHTGKVDSDYRVDGKNLLPNTAVIAIYTSVNVKAGVGDKGVFGNQLKSVFGEIMEYDMRTESGELIDATFGYRSIAARIVSSPILIGTTTTILKLLARKASGVYRG